MLSAAFYISTGVLAFAASSWLAYGFYYNLYEPKAEPVEKWLLPKDAIERFLPSDLVRDWYKMTESLKMLETQLGELQRTINQKQQTNSPPNPSVEEEIRGLRTQESSIQTEENNIRRKQNLAEGRVRELLISSLVEGRLIARGIPTGLAPRENDQVVIKPAQWQFLQFYSGNFFAARDFRSGADKAVGYDAIEIEKAS